MTTETMPSRSEFATTLQILQIVCFAFLCYLTIGMPLAVLPNYVHGDLGCGAVVAGAVISVQYLATLLTRPLTGRMADKVGPKRTVSLGLLGCSASGVFLWLAVLCQRWPELGVALLVCSRLALGFGESLVGTGAILWGIGRIGPADSARVISWNGIASYGALALGAPLGVAISRFVGVASLGIFVVLIGVFGYGLSRITASVPTIPGKRMSYRSVFMCVLPCGVGLALGSVGFGTIATFVTLFYAANHWPDSALALTIFGACFVGARLVFRNAIKNHGGFRVAIASLLIECAGLLMLWRAPGPHMALAGAALTGLGFALIFPALGVEAVNRVPPASRGAALSAYSVFFDVSLGITGPLAGYLSGEFGFASVFLLAAIAAVVAVGLSVGPAASARRARSRT